MVGECGVGGTLLHLSTLQCYEPHVPSIVCRALFTMLCMPCFMCQLSSTMHLWHTLCIADMLQDMLQEIWLAAHLIEHRENEPNKAII